MPPPSLDEALANLAWVLKHSAHVLRAQELLSDLPVDVLVQIADAAAVLRDLAYEAGAPKDPWTTEQEADRG